MAGRSSRFKDKGIYKPKFALCVEGKPLLAYALDTFRAFHSTANFLFVTTNENKHQNTLTGVVQDLLISSSEIITLKTYTSGQAATVAAGLSLSGFDLESRMLIFNTDSFQRNFMIPKNFLDGEVSGYLETFSGFGLGWSFVHPKVNQTSEVALVTEKTNPSEYCSTGLYGFKSAKLFLDTFKIYEQIYMNEFRLKETYVAPMYNLLIRQGHKISFKKIDASDYHCFGTPEELDIFTKNLRRP